LNIGFKTDKEYVKNDDITFLSEIITNSIFWQAICNRNFAKFQVNFEYIINF